ncbi:MAG: ABC transporter permease [Johnsonella sp.]|nr:ABC transporter permease [Johnsonella sp.]
MGFNILPALPGAVSQGILWGVMALGVYITFRVLNIADLTVDGSFALGSCICAVMMVRYKIHPLPALLLSSMAGALAGGITGVLHTMFDIPAILAGILTQISLWSINLRIMGQSNITLDKFEDATSLKDKPKTIFSLLTQSTGLSNAQAGIIIGLLSAILIISLLYWFFGTELGSAMRATGNNEDMIRALGVDTRKTKLLSIMLSNALVGLSGGLVCQSQKYADINTGTGAIVIGLAAIVIGEILLGRLISFASKLSSIVVGSIVFFIIRAIALQLRMNPNDIRMVSAVIVAIALIIPVSMEKWRLRASYSPKGKEVRNA